jgi:DNA-binding NtrC family response regulator
LDKQSEHAHLCTTVTQRVVEAILRAARSDAPIMLVAETGSESDRLARFAHDNSSRSDQPFVALPCPSATALPAAMLFPDDKSGTLFLDEIGELNPDLQSKLIAHLESASAEGLSVRLISSTRHDPVVGQRSIRRELLFRLNVVEIRVPPLREHPADILPLARALIVSLSAELGRRAPSLTKDTESLLLQHSWPGNFRELRNLIEHSLLVWPGDVLEPEALSAIASPDVFLRPRVGADVTLRDLEREHIQRIVTRVQEQKNAAAILGIAPTTLWRKRKQYDRTGKRE